MQMKIKSKELGCGIQLFAVFVQIQDFFFLYGVFSAVTGYLFIFILYPCHHQENTVIFSFFTSD